MGSAPRFVPLGNMRLTSSNSMNLGKTALIPAKISSACKLVRALHEKSFWSSTAALPPDVRRGSAPPYDPPKESGLCPWYGLCPNVYGPSPNQGAEPQLDKQADGGAKPRLTSGGEAAALYAQGDFSCKAAKTFRPSLTYQLGRKDSHGATEISCQ